MKVIMNNSGDSNKPVAEGGFSPSWRIYAIFGILMVLVGGLFGYFAHQIGSDAHENVVASTNNKGTLTSNTVVPSNIRNLVLTSSHHQVKVEQYFELANGADGKLRGVVVKPSKGNGQDEIAWIGPHENHVMIGYMFDRNGTNLTMQVAQRLHIIPAVGTNKTDQAASAHNASASVGTAPPPGLKGLHEAVMEAGFNGFTQGNGPVHMTVVIDPNCIFCHKFWEDIHTISNWKSQFTVTWVPVGFLKVSSPGKAAAVLAGGSAALRQDETNFDVSQEEGSISPSNDANYLSEVKHNTSAWQALMGKYHKQAGTPTLIIGDKYIIPGALNAQELETIYHGLSK